MTNIIISIFDIDHVGYVEFKELEALFKASELFKDVYKEILIAYNELDYYKFCDSELEQYLRKSFKYFEDE